MSYVLSSSKCDPDNISVNYSEKTWLQVRDRYASSTEEHDNKFMKSVVDAMIESGEIRGVFADSSCYALLVYEHPFGTLGDFLQVVYEDDTYRVVGYYFQESMHDYDMEVLSQDASIDEVLTYLASFKERFYHKQQ